MKFCFEAWPVVIVLVCATCLVTSDPEARPWGRGRGRGGLEASAFHTTNGDKEVQQDQADNKYAREQKLLNIFNVVRFRNGPCSGTTRNGTCTTFNECQSRGGTSEGSCASSFGVCCVFTRGCNTMTSENCTYFIQTATTTPTNPCRLTACRCNTNVCRIRLDFVNFVTANPVTTTANDVTNGNRIGDCETDSFTVTSPGNRGSPVICGFNTGQHIFVDAAEACNELNFNFGAGDTTTSRSFEIKVTQYECGSEKGGPPDCLQYFTGTSGKVASFNFRTDQTTVAATATHLSNQCYTVCFRREANQCKICYFPALTNSAFGTSVADPLGSEVDSNCVTDYVGIPNGVTAAATNTISTTPTANRFCGRFFNVIGGQTASGTVCSLTTPFQLTVKFDANEAAVAGKGSTFANTETIGTPTGTTGFYLCWEQRTDCA